MPTTVVSPRPREVLRGHHDGRSPGLPRPARPPPPARCGPLDDRLGAPRYAERERASAALVEIGDPALPALAHAVETTRDPEVSSRVAILIDAIRRRRLTRPTLVTLDLQNRPLAEAVESLAEGRGLEVGLDPDADEDTRSRRVTIRFPDPIPFWEAVDELCEAGGLYPIALGTRAPGGPSAAIRLVPGPVDTSPRIYTGPFRIRLATPGPRRPGVEVPSAPQVEVVAEPGLFVSAAGLLQLSVAPDEANPPPAVVRGFAGILSGLPASRLDPEAGGLRWSLSPRPPGGKAGRFRGKVALAVAAREPGPTVIPLADAPGRNFLVGDASVFVDQIIRSPGGDFPVVKLRLIRGLNTPDPFPKPDDLGASSAPTRIEVVDAQGRPCRWSAQGRQPGVGGEFLRLRLMPGPDGTAPAEFRVYHLIETTTEVAFDFPAPSSP